MLLRILRAVSNYGHTLLVPPFILLEFHDDPTFTPHLSTFAVPDHRECLSLMFLSARRAKGQGQPLALPLFVPQPRLIDSSVPSLKHLRPKLFFEPFTRPVTREPRSDPSSRTLFHASRSISRYHDNNETANIKIWLAELRGNENHDGDIIYIYIYYIRSMMDEECFARDRAERSGSVRLPGRKIC